MSTNYKEIDFKNYVILAKPSISILTSRTDEPRFAAAIAASHPACPPPTTIIS